MVLRHQYLPVALSDFDGSELKEIGEALASGWVTTGAKVEQFEVEFAQKVGARKAGQEL